MMGWSPRASDKVLKGLSDTSPPKMSCRCPSSAEDSNQPQPVTGSSRALDHSKYTRTHPDVQTSNPLPKLQSR